MNRPEPQFVRKTERGAIVRLPMWFGPCSANETGHYEMHEFELLPEHRPRFDKGSGKRSPSWPFLKKLMRWN